MFFKSRYSQQIKEAYYKVKSKTMLITLGFEGMILVENLKPVKIEATSVNEVFNVLGLEIPL